MRRHSSPHNTGGPARAVGAVWQRAAVGMGLLAMMLVCVRNAHATHDTCTINDHATTVAHVVGTFKETSPEHDPLTDWIDISHPNVWTCTRTGHKTKTKIKVILRPYMSPATSVDDSFNFEGENYSVYSPYTTADTRIGYIMTRRYRIQADSGYDWTSPWLPLRVNNAGASHPPSHIHDLVLPDKDTYRVSIESRIRLLKRTHKKHHHPGKPFPRVGEAIEFQAVKWSYWRAGSSHPESFVRVRAWFNREDKTCTTPLAEKTVFLPKVQTTDFKGKVGEASAGNTGFNLTLNNCSDGVTGIEYKLTPVRITGSPEFHPMVRENPPWPLTPERGTLPLLPHSTAKGVRVQVLDGNGIPVKFDRKTRLVAPYTQGDNGTSIPLQARYLKTEPTITPGSVYATMSVLYMYK